MIRRLCVLLALGAFAAACGGSTGTTARNVSSSGSTPPQVKKRRIAALMWLTYRSAACASMADTFRGGSQAGVVAAQCLATGSSQRAILLRQQVRLAPR